MGTRQSAALTALPSPVQTYTFVNDSSYNNFLPSFHVLVPPDVSHLELQLSVVGSSLPLIGWLLGDTEVWRRVLPVESK